MSDKNNGVPDLLDFGKPAVTFASRMVCNVNMLNDVRVTPSHDDAIDHSSEETNTGDYDTMMSFDDSADLSDKSDEMSDHHSSVPGESNGWLNRSSVSIDHSPVLFKESTEESGNIPRLPTEIMIRIFKLAQEQNISLAPILRTSKLNHCLVWPMIHRNRTIHLNRDTLPGLASFMSLSLAGTQEDTPARKMALNAEKMEILERRRSLLAGINTLIIDDIQVMFGHAWREDLAKFCSTVVLPNVTKIIWRQDELREWEPPKQLGADKWMTSPPLPFSSDAE